MDRVPRHECPQCGGYTNYHGFCSSCSKHPMQKFFYDQVGIRFDILIETGQETCENCKYIATYLESKYDEVRFSWLKLTFCPEHVKELRKYKQP